MDDITSVSVVSVIQQPKALLFIIYIYSMVQNNLAFKHIITYFSSTYTSRQRLSTYIITYVSHGQCIVLQAPKFHVH